MASGLERSLSGNAPDPDTGEPMSDSVAAVAVDTDSHEGVEVVRAELDLATGQPPGFLFGAVARGSLPALINGSVRRP